MFLFKGSIVHAKGENNKRGAIAREPCLYFRPPPLDDINTSLSPDPKVVIRKVVALLSGGYSQPTCPTETVRIARAIGVGVSDKTDAEILVFHESLPSSFWL
jgi:hypothetical protein